jgi:uncharacterized protein YxjI
MLHIRDTMAIEGPDGETLAMVKKALIAPLRERWSVEMPGRPEIEFRATWSNTSTRCTPTAAR